jgi:hypothetical protein
MSPRESTDRKKKISGADPDQGGYKRRDQLATVLRIRDPMVFQPLDSGSWKEKINPDPGSGLTSKIFFRELGNSFWVENT